MLRIVTSGLSALWPGFTAVNPFPGLADTPSRRLDQPLHARYLTPYKVPTKSRFYGGAHLSDESPRRTIRRLISTFHPDRIAETSKRSHIERIAAHMPRVDAQTYQRADE